MFECQIAPGEVYLEYQEEIFHGNTCKALEQAASGDGGITMPGSVQKARGCGIWDWVSGEQDSGGGMAGLDDFKGPF